MTLQPRSGQAFASLPPLRRPHQRSTFATQTLKQINSRLQYYRRVLNTPMPEDEKGIMKRQKLQAKYDRDMKVRRLLNRAISNYYS